MADYFFGERIETGPLFNSLYSPTAKSKMSTLRCSGLVTSSFSHIRFKSSLYGHYRMLALRSPCRCLGIDFLHVDLKQLLRTRSAPKKFKKRRRASLSILNVRERCACTGNEHAQHVLPSTSKQNEENDNDASNN